MKALKKSIRFLAMGSILVTQSGCFGEFALTRKIYNWNEGVSESKFVRTLVFYGLCIIPVYAVASFADVVIFNLIEFWSGSNPLAMQEGDYEMQLVTVRGEQYKLEATKDTFTTTQLTGKKAGEVRVMKFDRTTSTWKYSDSQVSDVALMTVLDEKAEHVRIYTAKGPKEISGAEVAAITGVAAHLDGETWAQK